MGEIKTQLQVVPITYVPRGLSKKDKDKQRKELIKSRKAYKQGKFYTRKKIKSFKSKESPHLARVRKLYNVKNVNPSNQLAKKTKCSIKGLKQIVKKGQGAYYSSGSRPSQTGHSWGIARLASAITGGNASKVDYHVLKEQCHKNSLALKLAQKKIPKVKDKVVLSGGKKTLPKEKNINKSKKKYKTMFPEKDSKTGDLKFARLNGTFSEELLKRFTPNLTPEEILRMGSFGGTYFRPIYSSVVKKNLKDQHLEYEKHGWFKNLDVKEYVTRSWDDYNIKVNKYGVKAGSTLEAWESSGWITEYDPYGWFQWYCRFYCGRRCADDERQINRWIKYASEKGGRWRRRLIGLCNKKDGVDSVDDITISPVIRQGLQHWAFILKPHHFK